MTSTQPQQTTMITTGAHARALPGVLATLLILPFLGWPSSSAADPPRPAPAPAGQAAAVSSQEQQAARITSISLERTMCLGSCPAYVVALHRDGRATYSGKAHAPRQGAYAAMLHPWTFGQLARLLVEQGFFKLQPSYRARVTCQTSAILRVRRGGRLVQVEDYGRAGPVSLWGLQQAVDAVADRLEWRRLPALRGRQGPPAPGIAPEQLAASVERGLVAWRGGKALKLPALAVDDGLRRWARRDAERACGGRMLRGTSFEQIDGAASARLTSLDVKDVASGLERFSSDKQSPLRQKDYRRLGVGAALDAVERRYCVVVYLGR